MPEAYILIVGVTLLIAQISQCMLGSRCTEIETPCIKMKRDVVAVPDLNPPRPLE